MRPETAKGRALAAITFAMLDCRRASFVKSETARRRGGRGCPRGLVIRSISKSALLGLWKGAGCSYKLRPTIAGETAGDGALATTEGAKVGARVGGSVECIIMVGGIGCRVEKTRRAREVGSVS